MEINQAAEFLSDYLNIREPIKPEYSVEPIADMMNRQIDMHLQAFGSNDEPKTVQPDQLRSDLLLIQSNLNDMQGILDDVEKKLLKSGLEIDDVNENLTNAFRELEKYRDAAREDIERAEALLDVNQTREVAGAYDEAEREADQAEHEQILSDMRDENENMIAVSVYKDTTELYTQEEMDEDNIADLLFPESIVREYAAENEENLDDFMASYTADNTVGLVAFAKERGFEVSRMKEEGITIAYNMPDPSVSLEDMQEYGYSYEYMLPLGTDRARELFTEAEVYRLYPDGTEGVVNSIEEFNNAPVGALWGIEIDTWAAVQNNKEGLEKAKAVISEYLREEFGNIVGYITPEFDDLTSIGLAYTTIDNPDLLKSAGVTDFDREFEIQVNANLRDREINTYIDGDEFSTIKFDSMDEMVEYMESNLDFGSLTSLSDHDWQVLADRVIDQEAAQALDEHEAEFGADGARVFPNLNNEPRTEIFVSIPSNEVSKELMDHLYNNGYDVHIRQRGDQTVLSVDSDAVSEVQTILNDRNIINALTPLYPEEILASEIDEFMYQYDPYSYNDSLIGDREDNIRQLAEDIRNEKTEDMESFFNDILEDSDSSIEDQEMARNFISKLPKSSEIKEVDSNIKAPEVETKHLSNETKQMIDSANNHRVDSSIEAAKAAPGIAYGIADITAGEKVSGVIALAKAAPATIKSKVEKTKANIDEGKSLKSLHNDMKDLSATEKLEAMKEFAEYKAASAVNTVKDKPEEAVENLKGAAVTVMDLSDTENSHADHVAMVDKVADGVLGSKDEPEKAALPDSAHNMTAKQEKLTVSVSSKLVGEPFKAKDGNFYVRVKLPNENKADKSPWGSIVVKPDQVTENKVTGKTDISLNANGTVTIFKPEVVCYNQVNQPEYVNRKIKISTADLKKRFTRTEPKNIKNLITENTKRKDEIQKQQQKDKQINTSVKKNSIGRD